MAKSILLIEDDMLDAMIVKRALRDLHIDINLTVATGGEDAVDYLNDHLDNLPTLILLDLNMPRMNGFELLDYLQHKQTLNTIPVIVLSTSVQHEDIERAYALSARAYIVKPIDYQAFLTVIKGIQQYLI